MDRILYSLDGEHGQWPSRSSKLPDKGHCCLGVYLIAANWQHKPMRVCKGKKVPLHSVGLALRKVCAELQPESVEERQGRFHSEVHSSKAKGEGILSSTGTSMHRESAPHSPLEPSGAAMAMQGMRVCCHCCPTSLRQPMGGMYRLSAVLSVPCCWVHAHPREQENKCFPALKM